MKKRMKTVAVALIAAALVGGTWPANFGGFDLTGTTIVANAAETKSIAPGVEYFIGDTIDFGNGDEDVYVIMDDQHSPYVMNGQTRTIAYLTYKDTIEQYDVGATGIWITSDELPVPPKGVKVSGSGTSEEPYTFSLISSEEQETLADGKYKQTAKKDDTYYTRFVFVTPKSEIAGKSKAKFTATHDGTEYTYETNKYYTAMISNSINYTAASADSVLFVVTVSSGSDISADLTCDITFE